MRHDGSAIVLLALLALTEWGVRHQRILAVLGSVGIGLLFLLYLPATFGVVGSSAFGYMGGNDPYWGWLVFGAYLTAFLVPVSLVLAIMAAANSRPAPRKIVAG